MANISIPTTFTAGTLAKAAEVNGDFNEVQTKFNTYAVQTDMAKTITVAHTWSISQIWSVLQTFVAGIYTNTLTVSDTTTCNSIFSTTTGAVSDAVTLFFRRGGVNKWRVGTNIMGGNVDALEITEGTGATAVASFNQSTFATTLQSLKLAQAASKVVPGATSLSLRNNADAADNLLVTDAGLVTARAGLVATAGGIAATGSSTITGALNVTGALTAGTLLGLNKFVRRAADLNFTSSTDSTLTFAIGSADEWEAEYVLYHTNAGAATFTVGFVGPAAVTMIYGGIGVNNINATTPVGGAISGSGNNMPSFPMSVTMAMTTVRLYVKGNGTAGNVTCNLTASAGTGVLKTGSFVRTSQIA